MYDYLNNVTVIASQLLLEKRSHNPMASQARKSISLVHNGVFVDEFYAREPDTNDSTWDGYRVTCKSFLSCIFFIAVHYAIPRLLHCVRGFVWKILIKTPSPVIILVSETIIFILTL